MARLEADRDELMAEATALTQRAAFDIPGESARLVAGYRRDGSLSLYFGADPCYHFDASLRLRRAFLEGDLYRTQGQALARLRRLRTGQAVELIRHDLSTHEQISLLNELARRLRSLRAALAAADCCIEENPSGSGVPIRLMESLDQLLLSEPIALAPAIRGRR